MRYHGIGNFSIKKLHSQGKSQTQTGHKEALAFVLHRRGRKIQDETNQSHGSHVLQGSKKAQVQIHLHELQSQVCSCGQVT